jgi:hypothetical protein
MRKKLHNKIVSLYLKGNFLIIYNIEINYLISKSINTTIHK